ncbi:hypothetical protein KVV02_000681 [Mortierella alpina]|uniref:3beta-hydroxysteroid 3-dehydrogenase n=1 Tax=Mortierella alpina TaxID=64518 RepID=A0A9P8CVJ3_MORAP|nr:hypothetical protein KVV02_000681 [Mortierella alpina]
MVSERRVAIVTGSNAGVGYAIVQRLVRESPEPLTVILACRNKTRAHEALVSLELYFQRLQKDHEQHRQCNNTHKQDDSRSFFHYPELRIELVDVGSVASVLAFNRRILEQYGRVDYLFCNAGILPSTGLLWGKLALDFVTKPKTLFTRSDVLVQPKQHLTDDGLGNVLACNVFGHYLMIKGLEDLLSRTEDDPGRVIWTSSMTAEKACFDLQDWQGLESVQPYESSKWVTDLVAIRLNDVWSGRISSADEKPSSDSASSSASESNITQSNTTASRRVTRSSSKKALEPPVCNPPKKHIISITTHPGVVASGIGGLAFWIVLLRIGAHYLVRLIGEASQTITSYHGALSNSYVALKTPVDKLDPRSRYGSCVKPLGQEFLEVKKVLEYEEGQAKVVMDEFEKLRLKFTADLS